MKPIHIKEGIRYFIASSKAKIIGFREFKGSADEICMQIVSHCYNGKYFNTSIRNFSQFWTRDFGMCAEALVKTGHKELVKESLLNVVALFRKKGHIRTALTPEGRPFDFPYYAEDSLPFIIHSIRSADPGIDKSSFSNYLKDEIEYYFDNVFDKKSGLIRDDKNFSSMKDYAKRNSSCYGNCLLAMMSDDIDYLKLPNPFKKYNIKNRIMKEFWNGKYFFEDLNKNPVVTGDANTFPFWTGVCNSRSKFKSCLKSMQDSGLDRPLPLKYSNKRPDEIAASIFNPGYEHDTVWLHLGLCFLDVVKRYDREQFKTYLDQYTEMIERYRTFPEVLDNKGKPFRTRFYYCDEGMLWASKYLFLRK